jgi:hypothetical protein
VRNGPCSRSQREALVDSRTSQLLSPVLAHGHGALIRGPLGTLDLGDRAPASQTSSLGRRAFTHTASVAGVQTGPKVPSPTEERPCPPDSPRAPMSYDLP